MAGSATYSRSKVVIALRPNSGDNRPHHRYLSLIHIYTYSGNEYGLRYRLTPGKRSVPDPEGGEGAVKEESILTVDYWPDPWTLEMTDPALRRQEIFPLTDEGRAAAASCLEDAFNADPERWKNCPDMMDCDPWTPPAPEPEEEAEARNA